jgi:hypothetical protein
MAEKKAKPVAKPERSEVIAQCVIYLQQLASYDAGFKADATGESEYPGRGNQIGKAKRAGPARRSESGLYRRKAAAICKGTSRKGDCAECIIWTAPARRSGSDRERLRSIVCARGRGLSERRGGPIISSIIEFPIADRPVTESEIDKLHSAAFRDLEPGICDCTTMAKIAAQMVFAKDDSTNREFVLAVAHVSEMLTALRANYYAAYHGEKRHHEAPAPIATEAQLAAAGRSRKTAEAVKQRGAGSGVRAPLNHRGRQLRPPYPRFIAARTRLRHRRAAWEGYQANHCRKSGCCQTCPTCQ